MSLTAALQLFEAGISVVRVTVDGKKKPAGEWKEYQQRRAGHPELTAWFGNGARPGIGVVTGAVSGNLEMTEIEGRAAEQLGLLQQRSIDAGLGWIWERFSGWVEQSPSGGIHWFYRIQDQPVPGNQKIASRPATPEELQEKPGERKKVLAETRGEGGFVVVAPSGGKVHDTGRPWEIISGSPDTVPTVTWEEREAFHSILATLHEEPEPDGRPAPTPRPRQPEDGLSPLDDYEQKTDWKDILLPAGWTYAFADRDGHTHYWIRPGKKPFSGISASTGKDPDRDRLYVFTSATEFEQETPYTKQGAYALLHHNGDHSAAASALRKNGYGADRERPIPGRGTTPELQASPFHIESEIPSWPEKPANPAPDATPQESSTPAWNPFTGGPEAPSSDTATPSTPAPTAADTAGWTTPTGGTDGNLATVTDLATKRRANTTVALSDDGNAMLLAAMFGPEIRYCPERGKWLHWTGQIWEWQAKGGGHVRELAKDAIRAMDTPDNETRQHRRKSLNSTSISNMLISAQTHAELVVSLDQLDAQPWELNTPGGIIDLRTGKLGESRPEKLHTRMTKHTPDFEADRAMWLRFLDQTFAGNQELIAYMQRLIGYTAVGEVREHVLPFCYGTGGNGKGVFLETIARLLGRYASTAPNDFLMASAGNKHETEIAELAGKRMVLASEVKEESKFDEAKANRLTGGDTLTGRFMRQDFFDFEPTHTLWIMGNHQPDVQAGGNNFWRRMRLIPFTQEVAKEDIIPDLQNILAREHGPAILAWIAEGAAEYYKNGLQDPDVVRTATKEYAAAVDTVGRFLEERCITGPTAASAQMSVPVTRLRAAYEAWCHENGEKPTQGRSFPTQLKRFGILTGKDMPGKGTGGARLYGNVGLQASEDETQQDRYKDN